MNLERTTLMFPYCWVCEVRFKSSTPAGIANREDHHIFPRNAGGDDGPLVSLCDSHHSCLHKIASRMHSKKPFKAFLIGETQQTAKKLCWLASMVVKAEASVESDPNKLLRNGVTLNQAETEMMKRLQAVYPTKSRNDLFRAGLYLLFRKHFT